HRPDPAAAWVEPPARRQLPRSGQDRPPRWLPAPGWSLVDHHRRRERADRYRTRRHESTAADGGPRPSLDPGEDEPADPPRGRMERRDGTPGLVANPGHPFAGDPRPAERDAPPVAGEDVAASDEPGRAHLEALVRGVEEAGHALRRDLLGQHGPGL